MAQEIVYRPRRVRQHRFIALAPSSPWVDEIKAGRVKQFPPRADRMPMVRCRSEHKQCNGRFYPRHYVRAFKKRDGSIVVMCEDCCNNELLAYEETLRDMGLLDDNEPTPADEQPESVAAIAALLAEVEACGLLRALKRAGGNENREM